MFVTFTDWEFDGNVENAAENARNFWPHMKAAGAQQFRATVTGTNSIRTMTMWNSKEECEAALDQIRASASDAASMKVVGTAAGELALTLD
jgi:hypothetical protein